MKGQACDRRLMTEASATITYASTVSRDAVRIALMIAALNDLELKSGVILNAYVQTAKRFGLLWVLRLVRMPVRL